MYPTSGWQLGGEFIGSSERLSGLGQRAYGHFHDWHGMGLLAAL